MFDITENKGFRITFANGVTASAQWGPGNYADNHHAPLRLGRFPVKPSATAEVAIILANGDFYPIDGDNVEGYCTPARVLELINLAASLPKEDN